MPNSWSDGWANSGPDTNPKPAVVARPEPVDGRREDLRGEDEHGNTRYVVVTCELCGAVWNGKHEQEPRDGESRLRAILEGGTIRWTDRKGRDFAYRCRCKAGGYNGPGLPVMPDWLRDEVVNQGRVGVATYAARKGEEGEA